MDDISGFDPDAALLGSVVRADRAVGDIMSGIDPCETPKDWPYGLFMEVASRPNQYLLPDPSSGVTHMLAFQLDPALTPGRSSKHAPSHWSTPPGCETHARCGAIIRRRSSRPPC